MEMMYVVFIGGEAQTIFEDEERAIKTVDSWNQKCDEVGMKLYSYIEELPVIRKGE